MANVEGTAPMASRTGTDSSTAESIVRADGRGAERRIWSSVTIKARGVKRLFWWGRILRAV